MLRPFFRARAPSLKYNMLYNMLRYIIVSYNRIIYILLDDDRREDRHRLDSTIFVLHDSCDASDISRDPSRERLCDDTVSSDTLHHDRPSSSLVSLLKWIAVSP